MIELINANVRLDFGWFNKDLSQTAIRDAVAVYEEVRLYVKVDGSLRVFNLTELVRNIDPVTQDGTVLNWLLATDPDSLETEDDVLRLGEVARLKYRDLWALPIRLSRGNRLYGPGTDIPYGADTDIVVQFNAPSEEPFARMADSSLFTVNGRIVQSSRVNDRLYLHDVRNYLEGTLERSQTYGWLDFRDLGTVQTVSFTEENLIERDGDTFTLDSKLPLGDKTVMAVIDGYPHFLDDTTSVIDYSQVKFDIDREMVVTRALRHIPQLDRNSPNLRNSGALVRDFDMRQYPAQQPQFLGGH